MNLLANRTCYLIVTGSPMQGMPYHNADRQLPNCTGPRSKGSKSYMSNNPYGSLERKALKQRRATPNRGANEPPPVPSPQIYNPYTPRAPYGHGDTGHGRQHRVPPPLPPADHRQEEAPPIAASRLPTQPQQAPLRPSASHHHRLDREYAQNVHTTSRRMYESSQPFQMLDNPYNTQRRNPPVEHLAHSFSEAHIEPIRIDTHATPHPHLSVQPPPVRRSSSDHCPTDNSTPSSPQENAFSFFNTLAQMQSSVTNNNNAYPKQQQQAAEGAVAEDPPSQRSSYSQEESKPYEISDFYQYSERLRRARGISGASPKPPDLPPQPFPRASSSRPPSASAIPMHDSRSTSPYTNSKYGECYISKTF